jgi:hypothetical protein
MATVGELLGRLETFLQRLEANPNYSEVRAAASELRPFVSEILHPEIAEVEQAATTIEADAEAPTPEPAPEAA